MLRCLGVLTLCTACNVVLGLDDYVFEGGGGQAAGAGGQGGNDGGNPPLGGGGSSAGGGGQGGGLPAGPPQPIPDSATEFCTDGTVVIASPPVNSAAWGQDCSYPDLPPQLLTPTAEALFDQQTQLTWQVSGALTTGAAAEAYCAASAVDGLPSGTWRVPTLYEVTSLLDLGLISPFFEARFVLQDENVWTSTTSQSAFIMVGDGSINCSPVLEPGASVCPPTGPTAVVLCVTGTTPTRTFLDGPDGTTVLDDRAFLEWQKGATTVQRAWVAAVDYCNDLVLGGHDDWRLPNIKELASLLDPSGNPEGSLDSGGDRFWSGTPRHRSGGEGNEAFFVDFGAGVYSSLATTDTQRARCVRGPLGALP